MKHRFGKIEEVEGDAQMMLNDFGTAVYNQWLKIPERFVNAEIDVFQIMPNHMHAILILNEDAAPAAAVGAGLAPALNASPNNTDHVRAGLVLAPNAASNNTNHAPSNIPLGNIIGAYKSLSANACLDLFKSKDMADEAMGKLWHRNFFEVIIRDEKHYQHIADYIITNPQKWTNDKFFSVE